MEGVFSSSVVSRRGAAARPFNDVIGVYISALVQERYVCAGGWCGTCSRVCFLLSGIYLFFVICFNTLHGFIKLYSGLHVGFAVYLCLIQQSHCPQKWPESDFDTQFCAAGKTGSRNGSHYDMNSEHERQQWWSYPCLLLSIMLCVISLMFNCICALLQEHEDRPDLNM